MTSVSRLTMIAALVAVGILFASCSSTPLPPLFATVPAEPSGLAPSPAVQPAEPSRVTAAVDEPVSAMDAVSLTRALTATIVLTAEVEPAAVAVAPPTATTEPTATPVPVQATATQEPQQQAEATPTLKPARAATATRAPARPAATRVRPTRLPTRPAPTRVVPTPTPQWPKTLAITEQDLEQQAGSVPGLQVNGLDVTFADNSMTLTATSLRYGIVAIRNLTVQGHFTASNCDITFVADRIQPRNLATSAIPNLVNQTLDQQLGQWCVEDIGITPGQLVVTVSPR